MLRLRQPTRRSTHPPEPEAAQDVARDLLARVAEEIGAAASDYDFNVFPNLGYLVLSASAGFVERVLRPARDRLGERQPPRLSEGRSVLPWRRP